MAQATKYQRAAVQAAAKAGQLLRKRFYDFDRGSVTYKSHHEILTEADLASEKAILGVLRSHFPGHRVLSEEAGDDQAKSDYLWVVDPLDGTTNFSIHNPLFGVSIGLFYRQKPLLGVIYAPVLGEFYVAKAGQGAWLYSSEAMNDGQPLKVSSFGDKQAVNTFCHGSRQQDIRKAISYMRRQKLEKLDCRQLGSAALELAYVAGGRTESIMIPGVHAWDVAAGVLLVREAGGRVTDFTGSRWTLKSTDILATNGRVHRSILKIL
jgi:myo-inositol-1(or 4)-monophosphatase